MFERTLLLRGLSGARSLSSGARALSSGARSLSTASVINNQQPPRLLILGSGWGAYSLLKAVDRRAFSAQLLSPRNHMLFTPLLTSAATGTLESRSIAQPLRAQFRDAAFVHGRAVGVDASRRVVTVCASICGEAKSEELVYDVLVLATGARPATFGTPGVQEHALFLKELSDAAAIRARLVSNAEAACFPGLSDAERRRLMSTVVVGGGPTGCELAAEIHDFVRADLGRLYPQLRELVSITVVEASPKGVLGGFEDSLRSYALRHFARERVNVLTAVAVAELTGAEARLSDGRRLPCGLAVWVAGLSPTPLVGALQGVAKDKWGHIVVDEQLRVLDAASRAPIPGFYAIGDAAAVEGKSYAATAQVAEQQGSYLGAVLSRAVRRDPTVFQLGTPPDAAPFKYRHRGAMVVLGMWTGITDFSAGAPARPLLGTRLHGFASWLLWRSAYLTKLGTWRARAQVPADWLRAFLFGRDTTLIEDKT